LLPILPNVQSLHTDGERNPQGIEIDHVPMQDASPIHQFFGVEHGETFCRKGKGMEVYFGTWLLNLAMDVLEPGVSSFI
jgi:hypothetical protein